MSAFDAAFDTLIGREGGYTNNPNDPGGETKYGISKRSYPRENIKALTLARAKAIYKRDFWDKVQGDHLPYPVAYNIFDGAVNSGIGNSVRWMQAAAGVAADGILGPITLAAVLEADTGALLARYNGERLRFMASLSTWPTFSRGWARRVAGNLLDIPLSKPSEQPPARAPAEPEPARTVAWQLADHEARIAALEAASEEAKA